MLDCRIACSEGDTTACAVIADSIEIAGADAARLDAEAGYGRACLAGNRRACSRLAGLLDDKSDAALSRGVAERLAMHLGVLCARGDDLACGEAITLGETWSFPAVAQGVLVRLEKRCDDGSPAACLEVLFAVSAESDASQIARLERRVDELARAQCRSGAEDACAIAKRLADVKRREDAVEEAQRKERLRRPAASGLRERIADLEARCEARDIEGCLDLATLYLLNAMPVTARHTLTAACSGEQPSGTLCWNAFLLQRDFSTSTTALNDLEPWQLLRAACAGGIQDACALQAAGGRFASGPLALALVDAAAKGEPRPYGLSLVQLEPGSGEPIAAPGRALIASTYFATDGSPLERAPRIELVSIDRGDALAEVVAGRRVGGRALARMAPSPLSTFHVPVLVQVDVLATVPHAPVR